MEIVRKTLERAARIAEEYGRAMDAIQRFKPYSDRPLTGELVGDHIAARLLALAEEE